MLQGNKICMRENIETSYVAENEGKAIQRLSHLGIHPIYSYQNQTLINVDAKKYLLTGA
jgi:hypothetical protein